ncbi:hypothetical protein D3C75_1155780 [compost metagenome]
MDIIGVDQDHTAQRRDMLAASTVKTLGSLIDHAYAEPLVTVAGEGLAAIGGLQHFQPAEIVDVHEISLFLTPFPAHALCHTYLPRGLKLILALGKIGRLYKIAHIPLQLNSWV